MKTTTIRRNNSTQEKPSSEKRVMTMIYQIEVDDTTGPQVIGEMLGKYGIMPTLVNDRKIDKETMVRCAMGYEADNPVQHVSMTKYSHLKIVRKAV